MEQSNDERLWRIARKRANFKKSLYSYLVINAFFWAIWFFSGGYGKFHNYSWGNHYPWPVWVMLAWGMALGFQYFDAYNGDKNDIAVEEYKKLKKKEEE